MNTTTDDVIAKFLELVAKQCPICGGSGGVRARGLVGWDVEPCETCRVTGYVSHETYARILNHQTESKNPHGVECAEDLPF